MNTAASHQSWPYDAKPDGSDEVVAVVVDYDEMGVQTGSEIESTGKSR